MFKGVSKNITINSTNNEGPNNNTYKYNFKLGALEIDDDDNLNIGSIVLPNSVANVAPQYGNNQFAYIMSGLAFQGGSIANITTTVNSTVTNSNTVQVTINTGLLYTGYVVRFSGLTTTNPIYITNITYSSYSPLIATLTLNQNISVSASTTGSGFIVGNNILIYSDPAFATGYGLPRVNMYIPSSSYVTSIPFNLFTYITAVSPLTTNYSTNYVIITLNISIPYSAFITQLTSQIYSLYINFVSLSTGYYDIPALNDALHQTMYENGHYYWGYYPNTLTGSSNATIIYPQSIAYDNSKYGVYLTNSEDQPVAPLTIGDVYGYGVSGNINATFNDIMIQNGDFSGAQIPTNSVSAFTTSPHLQTAGWYGGSNGGASICLGNGTNAYVTVSPPVQQYCAIVDATPSSTATGISQDIYVRQQNTNYTYSFKAYMKNADAGVQIAVTFGTTDFFSLTAGSWITITGNHTITTTQYISFYIDLINPTIALNNFAFTDFKIYQSSTALQPIGNYWLNGYSNTNNTKCDVYLNLSQNNLGSINSSNPIFYLNKNNYSLGNMVLNNSISLTASIPYTTPLYTMPYGPSMNFVYGVIIRCNLVENNLYVLTDILDALPIIYSFGRNNIYSGDEKNLIKLRKGKYNNLIIQLCDQNGIPLILLDNNVLMNFRISKRII